MTLQKTISDIIAPYSHADLLEAPKLKHVKGSSIKLDTKKTSVSKNYSPATHNIWEDFIKTMKFLKAGSRLKLYEWLGNRHTRRKQLNKKRGTTSNYHNSLSSSSCAFAAAFSASSKTKFLSDSRSRLPDHMHVKQKCTRFTITLVLIIYWILLTQANKIKYREDGTFKQWYYRNNPLSSQGMMAQEKIKSQEKHMTSTTPMDNISVLEKLWKG